MKNKVIKCQGDIFRILEEEENRYLVMNCKKVTMPRWIIREEKEQILTESEFAKEMEVSFPDMDSISPKAKKVMRERFGIISGILPFVKEEELRSRAIENIAKEQGLSKQTIRKYLCQYLIYQDMRILVPKERIEDTALTEDEKNMRKALNRYFYCKNKNSLKRTYTLMLKDYYCKEDGKLKDDYPSFYQFRYFYRRTKSRKDYLISREGVSAYQRDSRPLLGEGIQSFAPCVGVGMLDSTICDIYLVNDEGQLIGRPVLTACVDAYSGLCCGYSLTWEGGMYSLRNLLLNVIADKKQHCQKFGIGIENKDWSCHQMLGKLVTDKGGEYRSENFTQLTDLGISIINLPPYRPELKGAVEKFFDVIQNYYKSYLKGKGVVEPDFQERGAKDYRKEASLTLEQFEKVILHCILFYNKDRVLENFPYTEEMLQEGIKPYANEIWNYGTKQQGANLIDVDKDTLLKTLYPRTQARFTRRGLKVNGLRYHNSLYMEKYLEGETAEVAYSPDDVSKVYLIKDGNYIYFTLIDSRFEEKSLEEVTSLKEKQKELIRQEKEKRTQAEILLSEHILAIRNQTTGRTGTSVKDIRKNRQKEMERTHIKI